MVEELGRGWNWRGLGSCPLEWGRLRPAHSGQVGGGGSSCLPLYVYVCGSLSPPPSARLSQLALMESEPDRTGWEAKRVL